MKKLYNEDNTIALPKLESNSIDSIVTDPPSSINFMGLDWDSDKGGRDNWVSWMESVAVECLRVLKPGGHALVWALPRTSHWTATAFGNSGFEIRDIIHHVFGSGFPKSLNISKAIDKHKGLEREEYGNRKSISTGFRYNLNELYELREKGIKRTKDNRDVETAIKYAENPQRETAPASEEAKKWDGFGSAIKPAVEQWLLLRKPISEKSIAENVLKWGTAGLNIDGCRVGTTAKSFRDNRTDRIQQNVYGKYVVTDYNGSKGRSPSHLILDNSDEVKACFPETKSGGSVNTLGSGNSNNTGGGWTIGGKTTTGIHDSGNASRYFKKLDRYERIAYYPKASIKDRDEGLEENNTHATVKNTDLMRYLCRLVTPPEGVCLDPFLGSGSTGKACMLEGFSFVGIEKEKEYFEIAKARIEHAEKYPEQIKKGLEIQEPGENQQSLF